MFVVSQKAIVCLHVYAETIKVGKRIEKDTSVGSKIVAVLPIALLLADQIQGVQIIGLPNLIPVKAWRLPALLAQPSYVFGTADGIFKLYGEQGVLVHSD